MAMNTNSNVYTVIYSTLIVVLVAALLAFVAMTLKPRQNANIKAETISQMLCAAQFYTKDECSAMGNDKVLEAYAASIRRAFLIDEKGDSLRALDTDVKNIELQDGLKAQNALIRKGNSAQLPVYIFGKDGREITVIPCYGAGLWGPVWGYLAFADDAKTFVGAYFDHESETPGLGAKIKDEAWFREKFTGRTVEFDAVPHFRLYRNAEAGGETNAVDAITGSTMTSKGLNEALNQWFSAYANYFLNR